MDHSRPPADTLTVVYLQYRYNATGDVFSAQHMVTPGSSFDSVSLVVRSWVDSESSDLLDWHVDSYALIPF